MDRFPKSVALMALYDGNDENADHAMERDDVTLEDLKEAVRVLRKARAAAKKDASYWGREAYRVKGELIKMRERMSFSPVALAQEVER